MSVIIDPAVAQTVHFFYIGKASAEEVLNQIDRSAHPQQALTGLMQEISNLSQGIVSTINIQLNDRVVSLYDMLTAVYESKIPAAPAAHQIAARHILPQQKAPARTDGMPLDTSQLLSSLLSTSKTVLTPAHFEGLKGLPQNNEPLDVCISFYHENLHESLAACQSVLGPINSLNLGYMAFSEDELIALISCCPGLTKLQVSYAENLTDEAIEQIKWPQGLQELDVRHTSITANGLQQILQACQNIQALKIYGCEEITHKELMSMQMPKSLIDISCTPFWRLETNVTEVCELANADQVSHVALLLAASAVLESKEHPNKVQAQRWLEKALNMSPQFLPAAIAYAELFRAGTYDIKASPAASQAQIDLLLQSFPSHPGLLACKARLIIDESLQEAHKLAQAAYFQAPCDDYVLATFAQILLESNNLVLAKTLCKRALTINPHNSYALVCYASLIETKDNLKAEELLRDALRINFHNQEALFLLGCMLIEDEDKATCHEGKRFLETLVQANPEHAGAHFTLASLHLGQVPGIERDYGLALHHFQQAYNFDPKNIKLLTAYGEFLRTGPRNDIPKALKLLQEAQDLGKDPAEEPVQKRTKASTPEADSSLAAILMDDVAGKAEDRNKALELCEKAFAETPNDPFLLSMLGELLLPIDPSRGVKYLLQVVEGQDQRIPALIALAKHEAVHEPDDAEKKLNEALKIKPNDLLANIARGKFAIEQNRYNEAKKYVVQALKADPNSAQALVLQARILADSEALDAANQTLEHIINSTKFGQQTRQDIVALLLEYPQLLGEKRNEALARLSQG